MGDIIFDKDYISGGYETITVSNVAIGFTAAKIIPTSGDFLGKVCQAVFCTLETDSIRFTLDGTTPTSAIGHLLNAGQNLTLKNPSDISNFRAIRVTGDASLKVTFKFASRA
jgi:hypothetical protein